MSGTDKRIQEIIEKQRMAQADADRLNADAQTAALNKADALKRMEEKWTKDTHIIQTSIDTLHQKLESESMKYTWLARPGNRGTTLATAEFHGKVGNGPDNLMTFNVFETGKISVYINRGSASREFDLMSAGPHEYQAALLDLFDASLNN
jgi:NAD-dependent SIR2 family protein deacetylase